MPGGNRRSASPGSGTRRTRGSDRISEVGVRVTRKVKGMVSRPLVVGVAVLFSIAACGLTACAARGRTRPDPCIERNPIDQRNPCLPPPSAEVTGEVKWAARTFA